MPEPPGDKDPFGTAEIRQRVLAAWAASPARFREDANAEEDLVHGAYRDRLLVELAQNAADAAVRAGVPGVLRLSQVDGSLRAANTGLPLDPAGVQALTTLRASAKRDGGATAGRFGVGFAAVLGVSDAPEVVSAPGGVRFSAADTLAAVEEIAELADEVRRRHRHVPVLRLPWPAAGQPPAGFTTEVRLPLRPGTGPVVRDALAALDAALLLALPALARVELPDRVLSRVDGPDGTVLLRDGDREQRWRVRSAAGTLPAALLASRPVEERNRPEWTVTWAVPVGSDGAARPLDGRQVLHAPTPSEEPVSLPARLVATFPFGPDRRHVAPGPITDLLVERSASEYAGLVAELPATPALLAMVPRGGIAAAELDAALAHAVLAALRATAWLPPAAGAALLAPREAAVVDAASPELVDVLRDVLPGLLPADWSDRRQAAALAAVGVRRLSTADVVELVSAVDRSPAWWRQLYAGLAAAPDRDALAGLPVPLAGGRTVTGARGALLPDAGLPAAAASALGLRVVHPDAVHPLLERLGAVPAAAAGVLADERVRAAVEASFDAEDPASVADAVLALVAAAGVRPGELPWLAELALPGVDGEVYPAGELLLPGSPLAEVVEPDAPFGRVASDLLDRWGSAVLRAVGVLDTFAVLRAAQVDLGEPGHQLDGEEDWYDAVLDRLPPQPAPPRLAELVAARDLELVRPDQWPQALPMLAALPGVGQPAAAVLADGRHVDVPSYTRWWLSTHPVLQGRRPDRLRLPEAADLAGLYDVAQGDPALLEFAGCLRGLDDVLEDPERAAELLARLGDPARTVPGPTLREVYGRLAFALDGVDVPPPPRVRVAADRVVGRDAAVVLDEPYLLPLLGGAVVPAGGAPGPVADLLDLPFTSDVMRAGVISAPVRHRRWSDVPGVRLAAERCGAGVPDADLAEHDPLTVTGGVRVGWWPGGARADAVDVAGGPAALGRALAWRLGRWERRAAAAEAFARTGDDERLRAEDAAEDVG